MRKWLYKNTIDLTLAETLRTQKLNDNYLIKTLRAVRLCESKDFHLSQRRQERKGLICNFCKNQSGSSLRSLRLCESIRCYISGTGLIKTNSNCLIKSELLHIT